MHINEQLEAKDNKIKELEASLKTCQDELSTFVEKSRELKDKIERYELEALAASVAQQKLKNEIVLLKNRIETLNKNHKVNETKKEAPKPEEPK